MKTKLMKMQLDNGVIVEYARITGRDQSGRGTFYGRSVLMCRLTPHEQACVRAGLDI